MQRLLATTALTLILAFEVGASGAAAKDFKVSNPLDATRTDTLVEVPAPAEGYTWSVRIGQANVPAQYMPDTKTVRFVTTLKPHETAKFALVPKSAIDAPRRVLVTLNIQEGGTLQGDAIKGGTFHLRDSFVVPKDHFLHDGLIAFEGIGWESDRVAYRLYLDQRNVTDIFGKFGTDMIFPNVGHGFDDYQYPRIWGGDIFKVGPSLGVGGVGLLRDGKATQIGPATVTGKVLANGPVTAVAGVDADAIAGGDGSIHATYAISAGTTLTDVDVMAQGVAQPLLTGLTTHAGDQIITSAPAAGAVWDYIAVWGAQEHDKDEVGTVVFYRHDTVVGTPARDGQTLFVQFLSKTEAHYHFAARWVQEGKDAPGYQAAVKDIDGFKGWLEAARAELNKPVVIGK